MILNPVHFLKKLVIRCDPSDGLEPAAFFIGLLWVALRVFSFCGEGETGP